VPHQKSQKIDINIEYPCPCRRKGRLLPIALTEAMGCDRCQKIFVLTDNERVLEQLSSNYPYKCAWRWTGNRWINAYPLMRDNSVALICLIVIVLFCLIFSPSLAWLSLVACMILGAILVLFLCLGFIYWLVDRR
jgi:uncharacterized membrane protein